MFDIGNLLLAGLTRVGSWFGLDLFETVTLVAALAGVWLFLLRARTYAALTRSRKRSQRQRRRQQSGSQQKHADDVKPTSPAPATADADRQDDTPLLRRQAPQIHRVAVQSPTAQDDQDVAADNGNKAPWLRRTGPVSDPKPAPVPGADGAASSPAAAVPVVATGGQLRDLL